MADESGKGNISLHSLLVGFVKHEDNLQKERNHNQGKRFYVVINLSI